MSKTARLVGFSLFRGSRKGVKLRKMALLGVVAVAALVGAATAAAAKQQLVLREAGGGVIAAKSTISVSLEETLKVGVSGRESCFYVEEASLAAIFKPKLLIKDFGDAPSGRGCTGGEAGLGLTATMTQVQITSSTLTVSAKPDVAITTAHCYDPVCRSKYSEYKCVMEVGKVSGPLDLPEQLGDVVVSGKAKRAKGSPSDCPKTETVSMFVKVFAPETESVEVEAELVG